MTGFLVPPADAEAFAARLARLLEDPALARQMGQAGYERAQLYADTNVRRELEVIYGMED